MKAEYHTSAGRIDMVLQTDRFVYVMEFKLEGTAEEALQQIHEKHYTRPFAADARELFQIGIILATRSGILKNGLWKPIDLLMKLLLRSFAYKEISRDT